MTLKEFYESIVRIGMDNDPRGRKEVESLLEREAARRDKLTEEERETYDSDRLFNPYADTRILFGDPDAKINTVLAGIDVEVGEVLLAYLMNRDRASGIDLLVAHHPEGRALAQLHDVMKLQSDLLSAHGIPVATAEHLMEKRIGEVERRLLPANHERAVDAARLLGLPLICVHTPADNCVTRHLEKLFEREAPATLKDLAGLLRRIPEYEKSARLGTPPKIVSGADHNRCGRICVDMTGGTEGSKDVFEKYAAAGISTIVGMHFSEEALEKAKKAHLNMVVAGQIASDVLGLNLLFDELEKSGPVTFVNASGFERIRGRSAV
jgi:hypothetical protein